MRACVVGWLAVVGVASKAGGSRPLQPWARAGSAATAACCARPPAPPIAPPHTHTDSPVVGVLWRQRLRDPGGDLVHQVVRLMGWGRPHGERRGGTSGRHMGATRVAMHMALGLRCSGRQREELPTTCPHLPRVQQAREATHLTVARLLRACYFGGAGAVLRGRQPYSSSSECCLSPTRLSLQPTHSPRAHPPPARGTAHHHPPPAVPPALTSHCLRIFLYQ